MEAIFIGWKGEMPGHEYFMPDVWPVLLYYRNDGSLITGADPKADPEWDGLPGEPYPITPGGKCLLPSGNPALMELARQTHQFAPVEAFELITEWYAAGLSGKDIYERLLDRDLVLLPGQEAPGEPKVGG